MRRDCFGSGMWIALCCTLGLCAGCGDSAHDPPQSRQRLVDLQARVKSVDGWLTIVSLKSTAVVNSDGALLSGLRRLEDLRLSQTRFGDDGLNAMARLPELRVLDLSETKVTDAGLANLERFPRLETLRLNQTAITDRGLERLEKISTLSTLEVHGTAVTAEGVQRLTTALPACQVLWDVHIESRPPSTISREPLLVAISQEERQRRREALLESWQESSKAVLPADLDEDLLLRWTDGDLPGGAILPRWRQQHGPQEVADSQFQKIIGVMAGATPDELIILGTSEPGWPTLSAEDILDACAVGWQSAEIRQPGGVTFVPPPEAAAQKQTDGVNVRVEYFGAAADTVVGHASYEADRLMKCLSVGEDNLTRQPLTVNIPGWQSELQRGLGLKKGNSTGEGAWHRFWIEPRSGLVRSLADDSLRIVELRLGIETRHQDFRGGQLTDSRRTADPAARAFAEDLTRHYDEIAREYPSFAAVYNMAALASLVGSTVASDESHSTRLPEWLMPVSQIGARYRPTPLTTPSMTVSAERKEGNTRHIAQVSGGVTLKPVSLRVDDDAALRKLHADVISTRPPDQPTWTVTTAPRRIEATAARIRRRPHSWQTDMRSGAVELVRELVASFREPAAPLDWQVRVPRLERDQVSVELASGDSVERSLTVWDVDGVPRRLSPGRVQLPTASGVTPSYSSRDGRHTVALYKNVWIQVDEPVAFISTNGGPPVPTPRERGRWIEYEPTAPHTVRSVTTSAGRTDYKWDGARLGSIRSAGDEIRLTYDSRGRLTQAVDGDGKQVRYDYDPRGKLAVVSRNGQVQQRYEYDRDGGLRHVELPESTRIHEAPPATVRTRITPRKPEAESDQLAQQIANAGDSVLAIKPIDAHTFRLVINGRDTVRDITDTALDELSDDVVNAIVSALRANTVDGLRTVYLDGPAVPRQRLALALQQKLTDWVVTDTADLRQSFLKRNSPPVRVAQARTLMVPNVDPEIIAALAQGNAATEEAGIVALAGHNDGVDGAFGREIQSLIDGNAFRGRFGILNSCYDPALQSMVEACLTSGGAMGIIEFLQPIDARLLPYVQSAVREAAAQQTGTLDHAQFQDLFRRAMKEAKSAAQKENDDWSAQDLNVLDLWHLQTRSTRRSTPPLG